MLNWWGDICQVWCSGIQGIYTRLTGGTSAKFGVAVLKASMLESLGGQSAIGIYALFYIYTSVAFGVVVLKAYMLDCKGVICHRYMCIVLYLYRSARFGVVVFKASMVNWLGDICHVWCNNIQGIYAQVTGVDQSAIGICALFCH